MIFDKIFAKNNTKLKWRNWRNAGDLKSPTLETLRVRIPPSAFLIMKNKELLSTFCEYDNLKKRYFNLIGVKKRITVEVDLEFAWDNSVYCQPVYSDSIKFIDEEVMESKVEEVRQTINKDIENLWGELERYSEKNNISTDDLMKSFEESTN